MTYSSTSILFFLLAFLTNMDYLIGSALAVTVSGVRWIGAAAVSGVRWFGSPGSPPPTMEDTIQRLERVRENVNSREEAMWQKMETHRKRAQDYAKQKKMREARMQIRLRLLYDEQIRRTQRTTTAIESHLLAIQQALLNREVVVALHEGSRALGHRNEDEDMVDDVLEQLDEQHDQTRNIMSIIQENPPDVSDLDDDTIENELQGMMESEILQEMTMLPEAPTGGLTPIQEAGEEEEEADGTVVGE